jgi:hypothetical protein
LWALIPEQTKRNNELGECVWKEKIPISWSRKVLGFGVFRVVMERDDGMNCPCWKSKEDKEMFD